MFITFEGLDGSGKTTQVQRLASWLRTGGRDVLQLREPGGTRIGDSIRVILHDRANTEMDARTELLLYCASRAQLIAEQVQPRLASGAIVLSDRFADSTLAYQGYGRGLDLGFLRGLLGFATRGIQPDLTLFFDVDPENALQRRLASGGEVNRLDTEAIEFHHRVREGYRALIALEPARWQVIDASRTPDQVAARVQEVVKGRLNISD
jgi:dTMP kinase